MGELIAAIGLLKDAPTTVTLVMVVIAFFTFLYFRSKDVDIQGATSISKAQNEKLMALMQQNEQLLESVGELQHQVQILHTQMNTEAEEHRKKLEQTYKVVDEMRVRITELEDLVRVYQKQQDHVCLIENCTRRKK